MARSRSKMRMRRVRVVVLLVTLFLLVKRVRLMLFFFFFFLHFSYLFRTVVGDTGVSIVREEVIVATGTLKSTVVQVKAQVLTWTV